ncbi:hypothetical protein [Naumannella halotolerans]|uniref:DUF4352 domain-containing protein n=1 Tax=Naumannella halotolerans TaxID=993414 RepID=A0A4R7J8J0_9ACTN|nr:hypothetical protein [Naumannella halotolerans]TDT33800.1 hypothetical protein CLV29_1431 [Naumannella halotolerans]
MPDSPDRLDDALEPGEPIRRREFDDLADTHRPGPENLDFVPPVRVPEQHPSAPQAEPDPPTERTWSPRWVMIIAAVSVAAVVSAVLFFTSPFAGGGGETEPTPIAYEVPSEPIEGTVGESLAWYQHTGRGDVEVVDARWETEGTMPPSEGNQYLVLELTITATAGELRVNPLYVSAYDADGNEVFLAPFGGFPPELSEQTLAAGQSSTVNAVFELPPEQSLVMFSDELFNPVLLIDIPAPE